MQAKTARLIGLLLGFFFLSSMFLGTVSAYRLTNTPADFQDSLGNGLRFTLVTNTSSKAIWYGRNFSVDFSFRQDGLYMNTVANITCRLTRIEIELDLGNRGQYTAVDEPRLDQFYSALMTSTGGSFTFNHSLEESYTFTLSKELSPVFDGSRVEASLRFDLEFLWISETTDRTYLDSFRVSNYLPGGNLLYSEKDIPIVINDYSKVDSILNICGYVNVICLVIFSVLLFARWIKKSEKLSNLAVYVGSFTLLVSGALLTIILTVTLGLMESVSGFSFSYASRGVLIGIYVAALVGYVIVLAKNLFRDYSLDSTDSIGYEKALFFAGMQTEHTLDEDNQGIGCNSSEVYSRRRISILLPMIFTLWLEGILIIVIDIIWGGLPSHFSTILPICSYFVAFLCMYLDLTDWHRARNTRLETWHAIWKFYYAIIGDGVNSCLKYLDLKEIADLDKAELLLIISDIKQKYSLEAADSANDDELQSMAASGLAYIWFQENMGSLHSPDLNSLRRSELFRNKFEIVEDLGNFWCTNSRDSQYPILKLAVWMKFAVATRGISKGILRDADNILKLGSIPSDFKVQIANEFHRFKNRDDEGALPDIDQWTAIILAVSTTLGSVIGPLFSELLSSFI